jgi:prevent-host-death family protein
MASVFEAKTHFSALLNQVERTHQAVVITRHGRPVARLVPYDEPDPAAEVLARLRTRAREGGVRYDHAQLTEPLPRDTWGVFGE